jgi:non-ribosomal peptide synthase protein (TIGR01720 family)
MSIADAGRRTEIDGQLRPELYSGPAVLTVDQRSALHWVQSTYFINCVYDLPEPVNIHVMQSSLERLVSAHDALRARFVPAGETWQQVISSDPGQPMIFAEALACSWAAPEMPEKLREVSDRVHSRISLTNGPLLCLAAIEDTAGVQKLLVSISHFVADGLSFTVVMEDLFEVYAQLRNGADFHLPNALPIDVWGRKFLEFVNSDVLCADIDRWEALPWKQCAPLPLDYAGSNTPELNVHRSAREVVDRFDVEATKAVHTGVPRKLRISSTDFLTIVLAKVLMRWSGGDAMALYVHDPGRRVLRDALGLNCSRTVAALSFRRCVVLSNVRGNDVVMNVLEMKEQLERLPLRGASFLLLKNACERPDIAARASALPIPQVWFNYLGVMDALMGRALVNCDNVPLMSSVREHIDVVSVDPANPRDCTLTVSAEINAGVLRVSWGYSANLHCEETIRQLAQAYQGEILSLLDQMARLRKEG